MLTSEPNSIDFAVIIGPPIGTMPKCNNLDRFCEISGNINTDIKRITTMIQIK
jgi:hypothetical protein